MQKSDKYIINKGKTKLSLHYKRRHERTKNKPDCGQINEKLDCSIPYTEYLNKGKQRHRAKPWHVYWYAQNSSANHFLQVHHSTLQIHNQRSATAPKPHKKPLYPPSHSDHWKNTIHFITPK